MAFPAVPELADLGNPSLVRLILFYVAVELPPPDEFSP
jgi:hypothetical protein